MKTSIRVGFIILAWAASATCADADTLTFEDLDPAPAAFDLVPTPYHGLTFTGWYFGPDSTYTPGSGIIDIFTDYANPADPGAYTISANNSIESATPFLFSGATFSGYSGVTFLLWYLGTLVATSAALPDAPDITPYGPTFLASGYSGLVDKVVVSGVQGYYSMDDFNFQATAVPEPASYLTLFAGLITLAAVKRRRSRV